MLHSIIAPKCTPALLNYSKTMLVSRFDSTVLSNALKF